MVQLTQLQTADLRKSLKKVFEESSIPGMKISTASPGYKEVLLGELKKDARISFLFKEINGDDTQALEFYVHELKKYHTEMCKKVDEIFKLFYPELIEVAEWPY